MEWNVMAPFSRSGSVPFLCLVDAKEWNGLITFLCLVGEWEYEESGSAHLGEISTCYT